MEIIVSTSHPAKKKTIEYASVILVD